MANDVEYERRFFAAAVPEHVAADPGALVVQGYFVATGGVSLRVRVIAPDVLDPGREVDERGRVLDERDLLERFCDQFTKAVMTAKAPIASGARYEAERDLDPQVALALLSHAPHLVAKVRRTLPGGWFVDEFLAGNAPLVIAEIEDDSPVVSVVVPDWIVCEVTDEADFSNAELAKSPFWRWGRDWLRRRSQDDGQARFGDGVQVA